AVLGDWGRGWDSIRVSCRLSITYGNLEWLKLLNPLKSPRVGTKQVQLICRNLDLCNRRRLNVDVVAKRLRDLFSTNASSKPGPSPCWDLPGQIFASRFDEEIERQSATSVGALTRRAPPDP